jgi:hypothetical protein
VIYCVQRWLSWRADQCHGPRLTKFAALQCRAPRSVRHCPGHWLVEIFKRARRNLPERMAFPEKQSVVERANNGVVSGLYRPRGGVE